MSANNPIINYPDPNKPYFLFTDTSKYCWGATLYKYTSQDNPVDDLKVKNFTLGNFSHCATIIFVREVFTIYMSVKRLSTYYRMPDVLYYVTLNC